MAYTGAYTLEEAREYLTLWKDCERALATGQAKAYRVGSREFTAFDLDEVAAQIARFQKEIEKLSGAGAHDAGCADCAARPVRRAEHGQENRTQLARTCAFFNSAQSARRKPTRSG